MTDLFAWIVDFDPVPQIFFNSFKMPADPFIILIGLVLTPFLLGALLRKRPILASSLALLALIQFSAWWSRYLTYYAAGRYDQFDFPLHFNFRQSALFIIAMVAGWIVSLLFDKSHILNASDTQSEAANKGEAE